MEAKIEKIVLAEFNAQYVIFSKILELCKQFEATQAETNHYINKWKTFINRLLTKHGIKKHQLKALLLENNYNTGSGGNLFYNI